MLKIRHLIENFDLAKLALENWEYDADSIDEMLAQFRISSNAIYPYYKDGNVYILRLAPTDEKLLTNVQGELEFIEYLRENGYPAHRPVPARNGETLLTLHTKFGDYYASVFEGVHGVRVDRTDMNEKEMATYGRALAELHNLSARFSPKTRKWTYSDALDWAKAELVRCGVTGLPLREVDAVRA